MDDIVVTLRDESRVTVRAIVPGDACKLHAGFHALSPSARYQRFMGQVADLTPAMLRYLTCVDGRSHVAYVVHLLDLQEREQQLVAVGRGIRMGASEAELAITVGDPLQRLGLGALLLDLLCAWAERESIECLVAYALPSNQAIRRLLERRGALHERGDGTLALLLPRASRSHAA